MHRGCHENHHQYKQCNQHKQCWCGCWWGVVRQDIRSIRFYMMDSSLPSVYYRYIISTLTRAMMVSMIVIISSLLLLICVSLTIIGQPRNSVFIRRV